MGANIINNLMSNPAAISILIAVTIAAAAFLIISYTYHKESEKMAKRGRHLTRGCSVTFI